MTLTNHMLAGTLVAKLLPLPLAIPLAFLSHFVLDALPHFGFTPESDRRNHPILSFAMFGIDIIVAGFLAFWLISSGNALWLVPAIAAYSPDFIWIYRFIVEEKFGKLEPTKGGRFINFHAGIQKLEFKYGWLVEVPFGVGLFMLVRL